jgi:hypothetical protein
MCVYHRLLLFRSVIGADLNFPCTSQRARAILEIDEIIRDGGPDLTFPSLDRSPVPCSPLVSPWPSPALSASSASTAAGIDSTPVTPYLDLTERAAAKTGELVVPDVRVIDELRL